MKRHDLLRGGLTGLAARVNLNHEREPEHPPASGNGGITRMDIVFEPTPDAIPSVAAAILCIATTIPCVSQERDEAEAVLRQAMANASGNGTALDEHKKVRCRVACHNGRTTVILSDPDSKPEPVLLSRPDPGSVVYAGRGCSIWLADDLGR